MSIKKYEFKAWFSKGHLHKQITEVESQDDGTEITTKEKDKYEQKDPNIANQAKKALLNEFERFLNVESD